MKQLNYHSAGYTTGKMAPCQVVSTTIRVLWGWIKTDKIPYFGGRWTYTIHKTQLCWGVHQGIRVLIHSLDAQKSWGWMVSSINYINLYIWYGYIYTYIYIWYKYKYIYIYTYVCQYQPFVGSDPLLYPIHPMHGRFNQQPLAALAPGGNESPLTSHVCAADSKDLFGQWKRHRGDGKKPLSHQNTPSYGDLTIIYI